MPTSALKSEKTSGGLSKRQVNNWQENGGKIGTDILHLVFHHFQGSDWGLTKLRKQNQCNKPSFCSLVRPQDLKDQCWSLENWQHYSKNLQNSSFYLFRIR